MRPYRNQDCAAGLMFAAFGAVFAWKAFSYPQGTAAWMGPGYLPFWLGITLVLLGAAILVRSFFENVHERRIPAFNWSILILALGLCCQRNSNVKVDPSVRWDDGDG